MSFSANSSPRADEIVARTHRFIAESVIPAESDPGADLPHGPSEELRRHLQSEARSAGLLAPQAAEDLGGLGLSMVEQADVFEAAGRSLLGPLAMNCAAPDEGNIAMLERIANPEQSERYLRPLVAAEIRSCFAMTEPAPGAGSDPKMLQTTATQDAGGWILNGEKWFITGAEGAAFAIVVARTGERISRGEGATLFLVDADSHGFDVTEVVDATDQVSAGGHARILISDCFVPNEGVLGTVGHGYRYAQVRLAPARLTHCMRWMGIARRALDFAIARANEREAFGSRLADLGMIQQQVADSLIALEAGRLLVRRGCELIDAGDDAHLASSMAKVHVSETVFQVVDRSIQICGSVGIARESMLGRFLAEVRPFRIYDGPNEAHRWSIARRAARRT